MKEYNVLGQKIKLDDSVFNFSYLQLKYRQFNEDVQMRFDMIFFERAYSIESLIHNEKSILKDSLVNLIEASIETLNSNKIYDISTDSFYKLLYSNDVFYTWNNMIKRISEENISINAAVQERKNDLEYLKNNRDRVSWSGYGLGGAIKAATIAGAMNAFSGAAYSVSNSMQISDLESRAKNLKSETLRGFYNSASEILADIVQGTRDVVINLLRTKVGMEFYIPGQADYDSSCGYLETLQRKIIPAEDVPECICNLIESFPYNPPVYEFLVSEYGDENNDIQKMTQDLYYGDYILSFKENCVKELIKSNFNRLSTIEGIVSLREVCEKKCLYLGVDYSVYSKAFRMIEKEIIRCAHICDGVYYENDEDFEGAKSEMKEFELLYQNLDVDDENSIKNAQNKVDTFKFASKEKYSNYLSDIMNDFQRRYKTVEGITHDSIEQADLIKSELIKIRDLKNNSDLISSQSIDDAIGEIESREWHTPRAELLRNYFEDAKEILSAQSSIVKEHDYIFFDRLEKTDKLYELLILRFNASLFSILNDEFVSFLNKFNYDFIHVGSNSFDSPLEANKQYFKMLSHAYSYAKNCVNKSTGKKNIFSKLIDKTKETVTKGYQEDYNYFTQNGTQPISEKEISDVKDIIISKDKAFKSKIQELQNNYDRYGALIKVWEIEPGLKKSVSELFISDQQISLEYISDVMKTVSLLEVK